MRFEDRISAYPGRYLLTDANGNASYVVLERADEPVAVGTPLNAETFNAVFASFVPGIESSAHPGCYYRIVDDEFEWINPPMMEDVEYRIIERHNGLPVYAKKIVFTEMPSAVSGVSKDIIPVEYSPVSVQAVMRSVADISRNLANLPIVSNGNVDLWMNVNRIWNELYPDYENLQIQLLCSETAVFNSDATVECIVKYVKG